MAQEAKAQPVTAGDIVDAIRDPRWIARGDAIKLIELYAAVVANDAALKAARKATTESFDKCIAITDAALSAPLAAHPDTAVSP